MKLLILLLCLTQLAYSYPDKGFRIPKSDLLSLEGEKVSIYDLNKSGEVLFINFWAEWCSSCKKEIPELNQIAKKYSRKGVSFLGINAGDKDRKLKRFLKKYPFDFKILKDSNKQFSKGFGVTSLPQTFIIKEGKIIFHKFTPPSAKELKAIFGK